MILLILIFALLLGFLTARHTVYGVYAVLGLLPTYLIRFTIGTIPLTLLEVSICTVSLVWFFKLPHKKIYTRIHTKQLFAHAGTLTAWWYLTLFFIVATTLAAFTSPNHLPALGIWKAYFVEPLMFFAVCISTLHNTKQIRTAFDFLFLSVALAALVSIIQKFTGWGIPNLYWQDAVTRRVTSLYGYPNAFPLLVVPLVPFIFQQIRTHNTRVARALYGALFVAVMVSILFAKSDGALAGLGVGFLIAAFWYRPTRWYTTLFTFLVATTLIFTPPLKSLFAEHFLFQKISGQLRLSMWQETWYMLKAHPWWGGGLANYQSAVLAYHQIPWAEIYLYPHNIFLNFWTETGIFGIISFLTLIVCFFIRAISLWFKNRSPMIKTLIISMLILLVQGLVDVPYFRNDLAVVFWLIIGLLVLEEKQHTIYTNKYNIK